jgi:hypothetical protein
LIFELIYTSVLAPTVDVRAVADIVRRARSYNSVNGLTGILVFDGRHFCQHLEGDRETVLLLAGRIEADSRHQQYKILYQCFAGPERRFGSWSMAYALDTRGMLLEVLSTTPDSGAADLLQRSLPELEIQPP